MSERERRAAKVLLLNSDDAVLLFRGGDPARPDAGTWWFAPGGGLEDGETHEEAAIREVFEETGYTLDQVGPVVRWREAHFSFEEVSIKSLEAYFIVRVKRFELTTAGWTDLERDMIVEHRWWTAAEVRATEDIIYPEGLADLIEQGPTS